jgi:phytoene dehydrogenase-like protein
MGADTAKIATATRIVRRAAGASARQVSADICVLGAGIAGVSAALEAARLGRNVALVDALPALGGQSVNSIIGTFCGLFANGTHGYQLTHGIADDILRELGAQRLVVLARWRPPHSAAPGSSRAARRRRFVSDCTGSRLNSRRAFSPRMLRLASTLRNGRSKIVLGRSMSQCG